MLYCNDKIYEFGSCSGLIISCPLNGFFKWEPLALRGFHHPTMKGGDNNGKVLN